MTNKEWTALNILEEILEFKGLTPDINEWSEERLKTNEPRLVRFLRIKSALFAFGFQDKSNVKDQIESILYGQFLENRNIGMYPLIVQYIEANKWTERKRDINMRDVGMLYRVLITQKIACREFMDANSWMEAGNDGLQAGLSIVNKINIGLETIIKDVQLDNYLYEILDPKKNKFTEASLIQNFNFPDIDLNQLEIEWA